MNVRCPECHTLYRIDPDRVPEAGTRARCVRCRGAFVVHRPSVAAGSAPPAAPTGSAPAVTPPAPPPPEPQAPAAFPSPAPPTTPGQGSERPAETMPGTAPAPVFGPQDPAERAHRLARALVSDIVAYHGDRVEKSLRTGTLREDLKEEILKSWEEYVLQVGQETADETPYFRTALNEILARGESIF